MLIKTALSYVFQDYIDYKEDSCKWSGIVVCFYTDYGWYAAASYYEPRGYCGFDNLNYQDIYLRSEEIAINLCNLITFNVDF